MSDDERRELLARIQEVERQRSWALTEAVLLSGRLAVTAQRLADLEQWVRNKSGVVDADTSNQPA